MPACPLREDLCAGMTANPHKAVVVAQATPMLSFLAPGGANG